MNEPYYKCTYCCSIFEKPKIIKITNYDRKKVIKVFEEEACPICTSPLILKKQGDIVMAKLMESNG